MKRYNLQPENEQDPFDPRVPGKARLVYTIVAIVVTISLIASIAGYALWDRIF